MYFHIIFRIEEIKNLQQTPKIAKLSGYIMETASYIDTGYILLK